MDIKKFLICTLTSLLILLSCFTGIKASAEITAEQEVLNYCLVQNSSYFEQGIPYQVSYFQNLNGWTNNSAKFNDFISKSIYPNRMYFTRILYNGKQKFLYIINYDEIINTNGPRFSNAVVAQFSSSVGSIETMSLTVSDLINNYISDLLSTNYSGFTKAYISFSVNNQSVILEDGNMLTESVDDKKTSGLFQGIKNLLTGKLSLFNVDVSLADKLSLLGDSFNGWFNDLLDINVDVSSDEYNTLLNDLEYNTQNSAYINNVSQYTLNQIRNTYSNLKQCFDNSISVYNDNNDTYYYTSNSSNDTYNTSNSDNVPNYTTYEGDTTQYFNTYIVDDGSDTGGGSSGSSGSGGSGCNCNNSASATIGDIVINNNIPSGSGSGTGSDTSLDVDLSAFEKIINQCENYWLMVTNLINMLPAEVSLSFAGLITVVIVCRVLGR